jgi:phosphodiesterase/alkaline phosphatase D-like protein
VKPTERNANTVSTKKTGLFATLRGLLGVKGTGASKTGRGSGAISYNTSACRPAFLVALAIAVCALAYTAVPALAAEPEVPVTREAMSITGTSAVLDGELNHGAADLESEEYEFAYASSGSECTGGLVAPEPAAMALGHVEETVPPLTVTGLEGSTEYTFCVVAIHTPLGEAPEPAYGSPETFTTLPAKPAVVAASEKAFAVTPFEGTLEAEVNPENQNTMVYFQYSTSPALKGESLATPTAVPAPPGTGIGAGSENVPVSVATGHVLTPNTSHYYYQAVAVDGTGTTYGKVESFPTPALEAPIVEGEIASAVSSTGGTLEAQVNPNYQETSYKFEYSTKETGGVLQLPITTVNGKSSLPAGSGAQTASVPTGTLLAGTTYYYRVVATNGTPPATDGTVQSFTTAATPHTEAPIPIGASTATFKGTVTPLNSIVPTEYFFYYNLSNIATEPTATCTDESRTEPTESAGIGTGTKDVSTAWTGLQPNHEYTVCLEVTDEFGAAEQGAPITFKTLVAAPTIESGSEKASGETPYEAMLEAQVNPNNQATTYSFEYSTSNTLAGATVLKGENPLSGYGAQTASVSTAHHLTPGTTYYFRVLATNATGTTTATTIEKFEAPVLAKPTIEGESVSGVTGFAAKLEATIDPDYQITTVAFEYAGEESVLLKKAGTTVSAASIPAVGPGQPVSVELGNVLRPGTKYFYRVIATNATGTTENTGSIQHFKTEPASAPTITAEQVTHITETGATLQANIDPNGAETKYHFEYDTTPYTSSAPHGTSVTETGEAEVSIGPGTSPVSVTVQLKGLTPGATYYYRVVTSNSQSPAGGNQGPGKAFTTTAAPGSEPVQNCTNEHLRAEQPYGLELPDCRAYEMVSPLVTNGQDATDPASIISSGPRASLNGEAITYASSGSFDSPAGAATENQFISRRGPGDWSTQNITLLHDPYQTENVPSYQATAFTPNLEEGIASTNASLTGEAPTGDQEDGLYVADLSNSSYQYLGYVDKFPVPMGTSTDLSHVVFGETGTVSEWVNGRVVPVSVTNKDASMEASVGTPYDSALKTHEVWHAVSADGSRVYFSTPGNAETVPGKRIPVSLFVRVNIDQPHIGKEQSELNAEEECTEPAKACTIEVSSAGARYWGASADGTKAFYTKEGDLYQYSLPLGQTTGQTSALAVGAEVQGVVQISEEGSYVYFVAKGALAVGASEQQCRAETQGEREGTEPRQDNLGCNLYVSHDDETTFIARLSENDKSDWNNAGGENENGPITNTAAVSPHGVRLAFISERSLLAANFPMGYDNEQAEPGECEGGFGSSTARESGKCREIYLYDAETGGLVCASCNPSGARPTGPSSLSQPHFQLAQYRPRNLLEDGTLFFNSSDALVPHDSDAHQNVFEYENGHVYPISNVAGGNESFFLDASSYVNAKGEEIEGGNVFFGSADQLLPEDTSNNVVVWDARVGGGFPVTAAAPACTTAEACRTASPPTPAVFGTPPSATFSGPGNITPAVAASPPKKTTVKKAVKCKKNFVKNKKGRCVKKLKKKKNKAKKSAHINRRAPR